MELDDPLPLQQPVSAAEDHGRMHPGQAHQGHVHHEVRSQQTSRARRPLDRYPKPAQTEASVESESAGPRSPRSYEDRLGSVRAVPQSRAWLASDPWTRPLAGLRVSAPNAVRDEHLLLPLQQQDAVSTPSFSPPASSLAQMCARLARVLGRKPDAQAALPEHLRLRVPDGAQVSLQA
jgi:hypothetical protein